MEYYCWSYLITCPLILFIFVNFLPRDAIGFSFPLFIIISLLVIPLIIMIFSYYAKTYEFLFDKNKNIFTQSKIKASGKHVLLREYLLSDCVSIKIFEYKGGKLPGYINIVLENGTRVKLCQFPSWGVHWAHMRDYAIFLSKFFLKFCHNIYK